MKLSERIFLNAIIFTTIFTVNILGQTGSVLTISEIMFYPSETNGEFVEIYNTSATETVDLTNFKFKYYTSSNNSLVSVTGGWQLGPGKFAVILQGSYDYVNGIYKNLIPSNVIVLKTSTNNFGSSGMANTTSRDVYLINASGQTVDTYTYSADNGAGISDEKYVLSKDNTPANWKNSLVTHGTPGKKNSVSPLDNDLVISFSGFTPASPKAEDTLKINVKVKNIGRTVAGNFSANVFNDANNDSVGQASESIYSNNYTNLASGDSIMILNSIYASIQGDYRFLAVATYTQDENTNNNKAFLKITVDVKPASANEIVINEFMYAPANDEPEWIEIYNKSYRLLNLKNWKITDNTTTTTLSTTDYFLNPGEYLVISSDASISNYYQITSKILVKQLPSLNNSGDDIILRSNFNTTIDSVKYLSAWGGLGNKSLERISVNSSSVDPANWKTSQSKYRATPGRINSVSTKTNDLSLKSFTSLSKYAEIGKNIKVKAVVENIGSASTAAFTVKIFNDINIDGVDQAEEFIMQTDGTNLASGSSSDFEFSLSSFVTGKNQFIAKIEFVNDEYLENNELLLNVNGVIINEIKGDLEVNEIMYAPNSPEQEWIEVYNKSTKQVNLKGYKVSNFKDTTKVINSSIVLLPDEYFVITKDTLAFSKYGKISKIVVTQFPTLNNSGDKVILLDSLNRAIDSLAYKSTWGGTSGKSLERVDALISSVDSTNWKTAQIITGTPGKINSVSKKDYDVAVILPSINPKKPIIGETVKINVAMWNPGKKIATFVVKLYEIEKSGNRILIKQNNFTLGPADDVGIYANTNEYVINNLIEARTFEYFADFPLDQDTTNNRRTIIVQPGYPPSSVVINEIMYTPANGEPEWIELFNNSTYDIDFENWSITDVLTTPLKTKIQAKNYIFPSNTFLVIAKDSTIKNYHSTLSSKLMISSFANLNNDADGVVIKDSRDVTIDSVRFDSYWGGTNGKSLERRSISSSSLDRNNWASSKDIELSTPGRINSITQKKFDLTINAISTIPQYPAYNDEVNLTVKVVNYGTEKAASFIVNFYLRQNNISTFIDSRSSANLNGGDSTWITSNTKLKLDDSKTIFCKVIFISDEDTLNNSFTSIVSPGQKKNSVLVSEVMYDPLTDESEWIEIYNASAENINLKNWSVGDLLPSPTKSLITSKDNLLSPGEYAIIVYDSTKYHYYPPKKFFQAKFGSLSTADGVLIYDFRNAAIDSLKYNSSWGGTKGFSLERLNFTSSTNDSLNWATTLNPDGGTPGIKNSIVNTPKYSFGSLVFNEIMYDPAAGNSEYLEFYNTTNDSIQIGGMEIKIGASNKFKLSKTYCKVAPGDYFVLSGDSTIYNNYSWLKLDNKTRLAGSSSFSLSNDGTTLVLKDMQGSTLDSLIYSSSWHNKNVYSTKNKSLERLNPLLSSSVKSNWSTNVSVEGGSPGRQNSIYAENVSHESKVTISPNPFSPDNDGFEDNAIINFDLNQSLSQVRIKVFDSQGRLVRTLAENRPSASKNSVIFDGMDDSGKPLRIGIYILLIETVTEGSGNVEVIKTPIVVARKL